MSIKYTLEEFMVEKLIRNHSHKKTSSFVKKYITNDKTRKEFLFTILEVFIDYYIDDNYYTLDTIYKLCYTNIDNLDKIKSKLISTLSLLHYLDQCNMSTIIREIPQLDSMTKQQLVDLSEKNNTSFADHFITSFRELLNGNIYNLLCCLVEIVLHGKYEQTAYIIITYILSLKNSSIFFNSTNTSNIVAILFNILTKMEVLSLEVRRYVLCCMKIFEYMNPKSFEKKLAKNKCNDETVYGKSVKLVYIAYTIAIKNHTRYDKYDIDLDASSSDFLFTYHPYDEYLMDEMKHEKGLKSKESVYDQRDMVIHDHFCNSVENVSKKYSIVKM